MQENVPLGEILEAFYFCKSWWIYSKLLTESEICITGYKFEPAGSRRHHFQVIFLVCQFNISSKLHFFWRAIGISCIRKHYLTTWWIYNTSKLGKASTFICYTVYMYLFELKIVTEWNPITLSFPLYEVYKKYIFAFFA